MSQDLPSPMGRHLPPVWAVQPGVHVRNWFGRVHRGALPPVMTVLEQMDRMIEVRLVAASVETGLVDAIAADTATASDLARRCDLDPDATFRVLRYLASKGWLSVRPRRGPVDATTRFGLTRSGSLLRADHPAGLRDWVRFAGSNWMSRIWDRADHSLRTGESASVAATGLEFFDYLTTEPGAEATFDGAMAAGSGLTATMLAAAFDFAPFGRICDVAGGTGQMLTAALRLAPAATGVLYERTSVIDRAAGRLARDPICERIDLVAGDMFDAVPADCDLYLLLAVVHDWDDEAAGKVLANVAQRLGPNGRALVVESVVPTHTGNDFSLTADVLMLVLTGSGRERTAVEFDALFASAGLRIAKDLVLPNLFHAFELEAQ